MTYSEKVDHHDNTGLIIGIVFGVGFGVGIIVGCICFLCKRTVCFETIKPNPETGKEKNNINRTDPESPSAETALLNKSRTDDDKTVRVSDTTEDKVKPTTLESGAR
ncbi:unnamed protein product [Lymnaea stagnalis]|uniref:Uncharacterized protein n=1 Tax=Lymnaea stagnalis TaxID=6523 RepID=A0AAV2HMR0_LYMST